MKYRNRKNAEAIARIWGRSLDQASEWQIKALDADTTEIILYDVLGWPFNDISELIHNLAAITTPKIRVRINSPGGDAFDGLAFYNALNTHPAQVTTRIEGMAASIASIIAMAGDPVEIHQNAMLMIHEPWIFAMGDQYELREIADFLQKISVNLVRIYYAKSGGSKSSEREQLEQDLKDETWFSAADALARGLVDTVLDEPAVQTAFNVSIYDHAPEWCQSEGRELDEREIERALRDAGGSRSFAKSIVHKASLREAGMMELTVGVQKAITLLQ